MVRGVPDKLPKIKADLVSGKPGWQDWGFRDFMQVLEEWKVIHPMETLGVQKANKTPPTQHKASQCRSCASCVHSKQRHHSSICNRPSATGRQTANNGGVALTATQGEKVCHPIVLVKLNGVICRALLDTGATASYASGYILDHLNLTPSHTLTPCVQTIMGIVTKRTETYNGQVSDTKGNNTISLRVTRVDPAELLSMENPNYKEMISKYRHLKGATMEDIDTKSLLPVHVILGTSDYAKIKTHIGAIGEPVAEYTLFGWTIMSPGTETDLDKMFLAQTASNDYEEFYQMDVLGLEDKPMVIRALFMKNSLNNSAAAQRVGTKLGFPGKGTILRCPLTSLEA